MNRSTDDRMSGKAIVRLTPQAAKELEQLPVVIHGRVTELLERLEHWPNVSGVKSLRGRLAGKHRLRTGDYRVQFRVSGGTVIVEKIGNRSRFYED